VIGLPLSHIAGLPIEETLGAFGPALLVIAGAVSARLSARVRNMPGRRRHRQAPERRPPAALGS
jgi:hypothetical protein